MSTTPTPTPEPTLLESLRSITPAVISAVPDNVLADELTRRRAIRSAATAAEQFLDALTDDTLKIHVTTNTSGGLVRALPIAALTPAEQATLTAAVKIAAERILQRREDIDADILDLEQLGVPPQVMTEQP